MVPAVKIRRLIEVYSYTRLSVCACIPVYLYATRSNCLEYKDLIRLYIGREWQVYRYTASHALGAFCIPEQRAFIDKSTQKQRELTNHANLWCVNYVITPKIYRRSLRDDLRKTKAVARKALTVKHTRSLRDDLPQSVERRLNFERLKHHLGFELSLLNRLFTRKRLIPKGLEVALHRLCTEVRV
jgi:hypothetical protein